MSINDRLYDELLKPVVEAFYETCKSLAAEEPLPGTAVSRAWLHGRLSAFEKDGDRIAAVLNVPAPLWDDMRGFAGLVAS